MDLLILQDISFREELHYKELSYGLANFTRHILQRRVALQRAQLWTCLFYKTYPSEKNCITKSSVMDLLILQDISFREELHYRELSYGLANFTKHILQRRIALQRDQLSTC